MKIETLRDVLHWTREFHQYLASCLQHGVDENASERAKLLLQYLGEHEQRLVKTLKGFEKGADKNALDTWCYDYLDKNPIHHDIQCESAFSNLEPADIITEIVTLHQQLTELYRYLQSRAESTSSRELLAQMAELEKHEAMLMVHSANRFQDM
ncbi:ATPase [Photobacterium lipolyticum]|uniref:ATPase n=1 Tax=Photobacterium lipolyticum TaxID=266810 RepID=A0A2T3N2U2_9GAMM|nr:ATPase [Photobacterium lipolyticum]PSW06689.1 ATPase [Photobacterium lipolyticum]